MPVRLLRAGGDRWVHGELPPPRSSARYRWQAPWEAEATESANPYPSIVVHRQPARSLPRHRPARAPPWRCRWRRLSQSGRRRSMPGRPRVPHRLRPAARPGPMDAEAGSMRDARACDHRRPPRPRAEGILLSRSTGWVMSLRFPRSATPRAGCPAHRRGPAGVPAPPAGGPPRAWPGTSSGAAPGSSPTGGGLPWAVKGSEIPPYVRVPEERHGRRGHRGRDGNRRR